GLGLRIVIAFRDQIEAGIGKYPIAGDQKSRTAADFCNIGRGDIYGGTSIFSDKVAAGIAMKDQTPFLHLGTDPFDAIFPTLDLHPMRTALFEDQVQVLKYGDLAKLGHVQNLPFGIPCILETVRNVLPIAGNHQKGKPQQQGNCCLGKELRSCCMSYPCSHNLTPIPNSTASALAPWDFRVMAPKTLSPK